MAPKSKKQQEFEILTRITKSLRSWNSYFSENNKRGEEARRAAYAEDGLWSDDERKQYKKEGRPRLSFNMLPKFITNIIALFDINNPDLEVRSEHFQEIDQKQIDLLTNLLRNISFDSRSNIIYATALENTLSLGYGAYRQVIERELPLSFNRTVKDKIIYDPKTCTWDVLARLPDKSDGKVCSISFKMHKDEFKSKYPKTDPPDGSLSDEDTDNLSYEEDEVTITDYWEKDFFNKKIALLSDGTTVDAEDAENVARTKNKENRIDLQRYPATPVPKVTIVKTETAQDFRVMFYRGIKGKVLESSVWPGRRLPIVFWTGISRWVDNKEQTFPFIHWLIAPQRAYNYSRNEYLYRMMIQTYDKFLATADQVRNNEPRWENPTQAKGPLIYNPGPNGERPEFIPQASVGNDLQMEMNRSLEDLQMISGRFDPNFGGQGNEISGSAIQARQKGGNLNVKEIFINATYAIESGALNKVDLIPHVYDSQRKVTTTNGEGKQETVEINSSLENRMPKGFFTVKINVGPNFDAQQAEDAEKVMELVRLNPEMGRLSTDVLIKDLRLQHGPQLVERWLRYGIPQVALDEDSDDKIVKENVQKSEQNPQQQMQQQAASLELKSRELGIQKQQMDMMLDKMEAMDDRMKTKMTAMDDRMKAIASQNQGQAALMNADTNRGTAAAKGIQESRSAQVQEEKTRAEIEKADADLQIKQIELARDLMHEQAQPQQQPQETF